LCHSCITSARFCAAARANDQRDAPVVHLHVRAGIALDHRQQVAPAPQVMALPLDELARRFPGLTIAAALLVAIQPSLEMA
jgi:hypothetical protein